MSGISFDIAAAVGSEYSAEGFLAIQRDAYGEELAGVEASEAHAINSVLSRPMDPDLDAAGQPLANKASQILIGQEGGKTHAICLGDPRTLAKLPQLQKGEAILFAPNNIAQFIRLHSEGGTNAAGTISIYTTHDGTANGQPILRSQSPDPYAGIQDTCPWGNISLNVTGYHLVTAGGATLDGGGMSAPGLPPQLGSYWIVAAASVDLTASVVCLGPEPERSIPITLATPLLAYVAALEGFINATLIPGLGVPGSSTAAAAAWTALQITMAPMKLALVSTCTNSN